MLIIEKRAERDTLRALGATEYFIRTIFCREGYLICLLGGGIGLAVGVTLSLVQQHLGLIRMPVETFLSNSYPVALHGFDLLLVVAVTALIGWGLSTLTVHHMLKNETRI